MCNCVSLRYKCHISDITDIRLGVPDINADLHWDNQAREVESHSGFANVVLLSKSEFNEYFVIHSYFTQIYEHTKYISKFDIF